jgi:molecular chaperone GrpE
MSEENLAASEKELSDAVDQVLSEATVVVDEVATLTADLQRLQAEYANYRKRVDRDRLSTTEFAFAAVLMEFLPVLDDLDRAAEHGELTGGFKAVADRINATVEKLGLTKFADAPVASKILQPGYKYKERVIRPARVAVTDPQTTP